MALSVANGILWMREMLQDTDTTLPGATDAEYLRGINDRYVSWHKLMEKRALRSTLVVLAANDFIVTSTLATASDIQSCTRVVSANRTAALERMEWNELRNLQDYDSTTGTPLRYAVFKDTTGETWQVATHPVPDAAYTLNAVHTAYPAVLTTSDTPILGDAEAYWVYRLAAADMASILGTPELAESIVAPIPEAVRGKMGVEQKRLDPKRRDVEAIL
jgi:hypothetical protein